MTFGTFGPIARIIFIGLLLIQLSQGLKKTPKCDPNKEFACRNNSTICVNLNKVQDGIADCPDASDEECSHDQFNCGSENPRCINLRKVLDGNFDCANGKDEGCPENGFVCKDKTACLPKAQYRDGVRQCADGSDEACNSDEFSCPNEIKCIPSERFQDGIKDCNDGADEECLPGQHVCLCGFPKCLDAKLVKDGFPDCLEGSDEGPVDGKVIVCPEDNLQGLLASERKRRTADEETSEDQRSHDSRYGDLPRVRRGGLRRLQMAKAQHGSVIPTYTVGRTGDIVFSQQEPFSGNPLPLSNKDVHSEIVLAPPLPSPAALTQPSEDFVGITPELHEAADVSPSNVNKWHIDDTPTGRVAQLPSETVQEKRTRLTLIGFVHFTTTISGTEIVFMPRTMLNAGNTRQTENIQPEATTSNILPTSSLYIDILSSALNEISTNGDGDHMTTSKDMEYDTKSLIDEEKDELDFLEPRRPVADTTSKTVDINLDDLEDSELSTAKSDVAEVTQAATNPTSELDEREEAASTESFIPIPENSTDIISNRKHMDGFEGEATESGVDDVTEGIVTTTSTEQSPTPEDDTITSTPSSNLTDEFPTGLISSTEGFEVFNHTTTHYTTLIYGTFIGDYYAQIVQSTSSLVFDIVPTETTGHHNSETATVTISSAREDEDEQTNNTIFNELKSGTAINETVANISDVNNVTTAIPSTNDTTEEQLEQSTTEVIIANNVTTVESVEQLNSTTTPTTENPRIDVDEDHDILETLYTTYTYYTTMYKGGTSTVTSSEETITELVTRHGSEEVTYEINPSASVRIFPTMESSKSLLTSSFTDDDDDLLSLMITPTPSFEATPSSVYMSSNYIMDEENSVNGTITFPLQSQSVQNNSLNEHHIEKDDKHTTLYATHTYFTTFFLDGTTSVESRIIKVSSVIPKDQLTASTRNSSDYEDVDDHNSTFKIQKTAVFHENLDSTPSSVMQTVYSTITYFTTFYHGESSSISSREEVVTNVINLNAVDSLTSRNTHQENATAETLIVDTIHLSEDVTKSTETLIVGISPTITVQISELSTVHPFESETSTVQGKEELSSLSPTLKSIVITPKMLHFDNETSDANTTEIADELVESTPTENLQHADFELTTNENPDALAVTEQGVVPLGGQKNESTSTEELLHDILDLTTTETPGVNAVTEMGDVPSEESKDELMATEELHHDILELTTTENPEAVDVTDVPLDEPTEVPLDKSRYEPIDELADIPGDEHLHNQKDEPIDEPTDAPIDELTDAPVEELTDAPIEELTDAPIEELTDAPLEELTDSITDAPPDTQKDEPTEVTNAPTDAPTKTPAEPPTEPPIEVPTDDLEGLPIDGPIDGPIDEKINEPTENPHDDLLNQPIERSPRPPVSETINDETSEVPLVENDGFIEDEEPHVIDHELDPPVEKDYGAIDKPIPEVAERDPFHEETLPAEGPPNHDSESHYSEAESTDAVSVETEPPKDLGTSLLGEQDERAFGEDQTEEPRIHETIDEAIPVEFQGEKAIPAEDTASPVSIFPTRTAKAFNSAQSTAKNAHPKSSLTDPKTRNRIRPTFARTYYTTYTYYTTFHNDGETSIETRKETVSNVITDSDNFTPTSTSNSHLYKTYFTTYTYYTTTSFDGEYTVITSKETISNVVTAGEEATTKKADTLEEIIPTSSETFLSTHTQETELVSSEDLHTLIPNDSEHSTTIHQELQSSLNTPQDFSTFGSASVQYVTEVVTYMTTYTYYTTSFEGDETIVTSSLERVSNVVTETSTVPISDRDHSTTRTSESKPEIQPTKSSHHYQTGLISTTVDEVVNHGITTLYSTEVYGTYINGVYAHVVQSTSLTVAGETTATEQLGIDATATAEEESYETGLVSFVTGSETHAGTVTLYTTKVIGTYIDGTYAQVVESTSRILDESSTEADVLPTETNTDFTDSYKTGLISTEASSEVLDGITTIFESRVIGTYVDGTYAQIIQSTSRILIDSTTQLFESTASSVENSPTAFHEDATDTGVVTEDNQTDDPKQDHTQDVDDTPQITTTTEGTTIEEENSLTTTTDITTAATPDTTTGSPLRRRPLVPQGSRPPLRSFRNRQRPSNKFNLHRNGAKEPEIDEEEISSSPTTGTTPQQTSGRGSAVTGTRSLSTGVFGKQTSLPGHTQASLRSSPGAQGSTRLSSPGGRQSTRRTGVILSSSLSSDFQGQRTSSVLRTSGAKLSTRRSSGFQSSSIFRSSSFEDILHSSVARESSDLQSIGFNDGVTDDGKISTGTDENASEGTTNSGQDLQISSLSTAGIRDVISPTPTNKPGFSGSKFPTTQSKQSKLPTTTASEATTDKPVSKFRVSLRSRANLRGKRPLRPGSRPVSTQQSQSDAGGEDDIVVEETIQQESKTDLSHDDFEASVTEKALVSKRRPLFTSSRNTATGSRPFGSKRHSTSPPIIPDEEKTQITDSVTTTDEVLSKGTDQITISSDASPTEATKAEQPTTTERPNASQRLLRLRNRLAARRRTRRLSEYSEGSSDVVSHRKKRSTAVHADTFNDDAEAAYEAEDNFGGHVPISQEKDYSSRGSERMETRAPRPRTRGRVTPPSNLRQQQQNPEPQTEAPKEKTHEEKVMEARRQNSQRRRSRWQVRTAASARETQDIKPTRQRATQEETTVTQPIRRRSGIANRRIQTTAVNTATVAATTTTNNRGRLRIIQPTRPISIRQRTALKHSPVETRNSEETTTAKNTGRGRVRATKTAAPRQSRPTRLAYKRRNLSRRTRTQAINKATETLSHTTSLATATTLEQKGRVKTTTTPVPQVLTTSTAQIPIVPTKTEVTVTHAVNTTKIVPIYRGQRTELRTISTAYNSEEVIQPSQYSIVVDGGVAKSVISSYSSVGHETPALTTVHEVIITSAIQETVAMSQGRLASTTRTVHYLTTVSSTVNPDLGTKPSLSLASMLLSQLLLNQFFPQNQQISYVTSTQTYVTTVTVANTAIIPIKFRDKTKLSTITQTTVMETTVTSVTSVSVNVLPTQLSQLSNLLPALLNPLQLQQPHIDTAPTLVPEVQQIFQQSHVNEEPPPLTPELPPPSEEPTPELPPPTLPGPVTSVLTLYLSGSLPGQFNTFLTTVTLDNIDATEVAEPVRVSRDIYRMTDGYSFQKHKYKDEDDFNEIDNDIGAFDAPLKRGKRQIYTGLVTYTLYTTVPIDGSLSTISTELTLTQVATNNHRYDELTRMKQSDIYHTPEPSLGLAAGISSNEFDVPIITSAFGRESEVVFVAPERLRTTFQGRNPEVLEDAPIITSALGDESFVTFVVAPNNVKIIPGVSSLADEDPQLLDSDGTELSESSQIFGGVTESLQGVRNRVKVKRRRRPPVNATVEDNSATPPRRMKVLKRRRKPSPGGQELGINPSQSVPVTYYTTFSYMTTIYYSDSTSYRNQETVASRVATEPLSSDMINSLQQRLSEGSVMDTQTVNLGTKFRGTRTHVINLASHISIDASEAIASQQNESVFPKPPIESFPTPVKDSDKQTMFTVFTYLYTFHNGDVTRYSSREITSSSLILATDIPQSTVNATDGLYIISEDKTAINIGSRFLDGLVTEVNMASKVFIKLSDIEPTGRNVPSISVNAPTEPTILAEASVTTPLLEPELQTTHEEALVETTTVTTATTRRRKGRRRFRPRAKPIFTSTESQTVIPEDMEPTHIPTPALDSDIHQDDSHTTPRPRRVFGMRTRHKRPEVFQLQSSQQAQNEPPPESLIPEFLDAESSAEIQPSVTPDDDEDKFFPILPSSGEDLFTSTQQVTTVETPELGGSRRRHRIRPKTQTEEEEVLATPLPGSDGRSRIRFKIRNRQNQKPRGHADYLHQYNLGRRFRSQHEPDPSPTNVVYVTYTTTTLVPFLGGTSFRTINIQTSSLRTLKDSELYLLTATHLLTASPAAIDVTSPTVIDTVESKIETVYNTYTYFITKTGANASEEVSTSLETVTQYITKLAIEPQPTSEILPSTIDPFSVEAEVPLNTPVIDGLEQDLSDEPEVFIKDVFDNDEEEEFQGETSTESESVSTLSSEVDGTHGPEDSMKADSNADSDITEAGKTSDLEVGFNTISVDADLSTPAFPTPTSVTLDKQEIETIPSHEENATQALDTSVDTQESVNETHTYYTTYTYFNTFPAGNTSVLMNSTSTLTNTVIESGPMKTNEEPQFATETLFTTNTYFSTETIDESPIVHTNEEILTQVIVTEAAFFDTTTEIIPTQAQTLTSTEQFSTDLNEQLDSSLAISSFISSSKHDPSTFSLPISTNAGGVYATKTYYTTYTYFTTFLVGQDTSITSNTEVVSNLVSERVGSSMKIKPTRTSNSPKPSFTSTAAAAQTKTYYTTFTYFTTFLQGEETSITSNLETISNVVTETVASSRLSTTRTSGSSKLRSTLRPTSGFVTPSKISSSGFRSSKSKINPTSATTYFTTFTYYTTLIEGTDTIIKSSEETISNVVTGILGNDATTIKERISPTTSSKLETLFTDTNEILKSTGELESIMSSKTLEDEVKSTAASPKPTEFVGSTIIFFPKGKKTITPTSTTPMVVTGSTIIFFPDIREDATNENDTLTSDNSTISSNATNEISGLQLNSDNEEMSVAESIQEPSADAPSTPTQSKPGFAFGPALSGLAGLLLKSGLAAATGANKGSGVEHLMLKRNDTDKNAIVSGGRPHRFAIPPNAAAFVQNQPHRFIPVGGFGASINREQHPPIVGFEPAETRKDGTFTRMDGPMLAVPHPGIVIPVQHDTRPLQAAGQMSFVDPMPSMEPIFAAGFKPGQTQNGFTPIRSEATVNGDESIKKSDSTKDGFQNEERNRIKPTTTVKSEETIQDDMNDVNKVTTILKGQSTILFPRLKPKKPVDAGLSTLVLDESDSDEIAFTSYSSVTTIVRGTETFVSTIDFVQTNPVTDDIVIEETTTHKLPAPENQVTTITSTLVDFIQPSSTTYYTTFTYFTTAFVDGNPVVSSREVTSTEVIVFKPTAVGGEIVATKVAFGNDEGDSGQRRGTTLTDISQEENTRLRDVLIHDAGQLNSLHATAFFDASAIQSTFEQVSDTTSHFATDASSTVQKIVQQDEQTHYEVTQFFTEFIDNKTPLFLEREEVSTSISTLSPTTITGFVSGPVQRTYYTTYYYYTTTLQGDRTLVNSRFETSSEVVTLQPFASTAAQVIPTNPPGQIGGVHGSGGDIPDPHPGYATFYTRFTYYTTYLYGGTSSVISSNIVTLSQVAPQITRTVYYGGAGGGFHGGGGGGAGGVIRPTYTVDAANAQAIPTRLPEGDVTGYRILDGSRTVLYIDNGATQTFLGYTRPPITRTTTFYGGQNTDYISSGGGIDEVGLGGGDRHPQLTILTTTETIIAGTSTRTLTIFNTQHVTKTSVVTSTVTNFVTTTIHGGIQGGIQGSIQGGGGGAISGGGGGAISGGGAGAAGLEGSGGGGASGSGGGGGSGSGSGGGGGSGSGSGGGGGSGSGSGGGGGSGSGSGGGGGSGSGGGGRPGTIDREDIIDGKEPTIIGVLDGIRPTRTVITIGGISTATTLVAGGGQFTQTIPFVDEKLQSTKYVTRVESNGRTVVFTATSVDFSGGSAYTHKHVSTSVLPPRTMLLTVIGDRTTITRYFTSTAAITKTVIRPTATHTVIIPTVTKGPFENKFITTVETQPTPSQPVIDVTFPVDVSGHSGNSGKITTPRSPFGVVTIGSGTGESGGNYPRVATTTTNGLEIGAGSGGVNINTGNAGQTGKQQIDPDAEEFKTCSFRCDQNKKEVCRNFQGINRCTCRPGQSRVDDSKKCEAVDTYEINMHLVKMNGKDLQYSENLHYRVTDDYKALAGKCRTAMERAYLTTKLKSAYRGMDVLGFSDARFTKDGWTGVVARVVVHVRQSEVTSDTEIRTELASSIQRTNYAIGGTDLVGNPTAQGLTIQDFDECSDTDFNDCSINGTCYNRYGSFSCECKGDLSDMDADFPGRICGGPSALCDFCNHQGECYTDEYGNPACKCYQWHLGSRCQINGLALAIILPILLGLLLLGLLIWCCRKAGCCAGCCPCCGKDNKSRSSRSSNLAQNSAGVFPRIGGTMDTSTGTLDKKAMITEDSSSESSGDQSRFAHIADAFGARAAMDSHMNKKSSKLSSTSFEDRSVSGFNVPPVMIPRAKHKHPKQYMNTSSENILQRSDASAEHHLSAENKFIDILDGELRQQERTNLQKERSTFATLPNSKSKSHQESGAVETGMRAATMERLDRSGRHNIRSAEASAAKAAAIAVASSVARKASSAERHSRNVTAGTSAANSTMNVAESSGYAKASLNTEGKSKMKQASQTNLHQTSVRDDSNIASTSGYKHNQHSSSNYTSAAAENFAAASALRSATLIARASAAAAANSANTSNLNASAISSDESAEASRGYQRESTEYNRRTANMQDISTSSGYRDMNTSRGKAYIGAVDASDVQVRGGRADYIADHHENREYSSELRDGRGVASGVVGGYGSSDMNVGHGGYSSEMRESTSYSNNVLHDAHDHLRASGFDTINSSRFDTSSYGNVGNRSYTETTVQPATRHYGADSYYSSSKGRSSHFLRSEDSDGSSEVSSPSVIHPNVHSRGLKEYYEEEPETRYEHKSSSYYNYEQKVEYTSDYPDSHM